MRRAGFYVVDSISSNIPMLSTYNLCRTLYIRRISLKKVWIFFNTDPWSNSLKRVCIPLPKHGGFRLGGFDKYYTEFLPELQIGLLGFLLKSCWFVVGQFIARSYGFMTCDKSHYYKLACNAAIIYYHLLIRAIKYFINAPELQMESSTKR